MQKSAGWVEYEWGIMLWDFRTGETRLFWKPFQIEAIRPEGNVLVIDPPLPPHRYVRAHWYMPSGGNVQVVDLILG